MEAKYKFRRSQLAQLPLTLEFTATLPEWEKLKEALEEAEKDRQDRGEHADPVRPLSHCIKNLMAAIDDATGHGYRTRGYMFDYKQEEAEAAE